MFGFVTKGESAAVDFVLELVFKWKMLKEFRVLFEILNEYNPCKCS